MKDVVIQPETITINIILESVGDAGYIFGLDEEIYIIEL